MPRNLTRIPFPEAMRRGFDEIIDVRSPSEYREDHVTGAISLPVLDDAERTRVGTIHKEVSPFEARKAGAALVSANIARHLETHFAGKGRDYRPLLYCWRGGQRSGSLALVLGEIGWETAVLAGGYKAYRARVVATIAERAAELPWIVVNGFTGAGKTLLLRALAARGEQVLDLEGLASHKGSVFGGDPGRPQPAQKRFESLLHDRLAAFVAERPVYVEAESSKIGALNVPNPVWQRMKAAPVVEIASPLPARAAYLASDYRDWLGDPDRVRRTIDRLKGFHADRTLAGWKDLAAAGAWEDLVARLLAEHYDRRYSTGGSGHFRAPSAVVALSRHDPGSVSEAAGELARAGAELFADPLHAAMERR